MPFCFFHLHMHSNIHQQVPLTSEDRKLAIMHTQSYHPTYRTACAFFRKVSKRTRKKGIWNNCMIKLSKVKSFNAGSLRLNWHYFQRVVFRKVPRPHAMVFPERVGSCSTNCDLWKHWTSLTVTSYIRRVWHVGGLNSRPYTQWLRHAVSRFVSHPSVSLI